MWNAAALGCVFCSSQISCERKTCNFNNKSSGRKTRDRERKTQRSRNTQLPKGGKLADVLKSLEKISLSDLEKMGGAIEEACERIEPDSWAPEG